MFLFHSRILTILCVLSFCVMTHAQSIPLESLKFEDKREINGVTLQNAKVDGGRVYYATLGKVIDRPYKDIASDVLRFDERCNNEYRNKRRFSPKEFNCQHLNKNLVESVIMRNIKVAVERVQEEKERFLILRNVYNRDSFLYYDLVLFTETKNAKGKLEGKITYSMLDDASAKSYLGQAEKKKSAFDNIEGAYILEELEPGKTMVKMTYATKTSYWLLTNSFAVGTIYENTAEGTMSTLTSFEKPLNHSNIK